MAKKDKLIDKYYRYHNNKEIFTPAENLMFELMSDMLDRRGFRQEWDQVDDDIQEDWMKKWVDIIEPFLSPR